MSLVLQLIEWMERTKGLHTVADVLERTWEPPMRVRILATRPGKGFVQSEPTLSAAVQWWRLDPGDFVEPVED